MAPQQIRKTFSGFIPDLQIDSKRPCKGRYTPGPRGKHPLVPEGDTPKTQRQTSPCGHTDTCETLPCPKLHLWVVINTGRNKKAFHPLAPTLHASIATIFQNQWEGGPQVNKFEQTYSVGHQMSLPKEVPCTVRSHVLIQ